MKKIQRKELSNLMMVAKNEKKFSVIINDGRKMRWVGFGWVDEGPASKKDCKSYPTVVD